MPDSRELTAGTWVLRTQKHLLSAAVTFSRDGQIIGTDKVTRSHWDLAEGKLRLLDKKGKVTAILERLEGGGYSGPLTGNNAVVLSLESTTWEDRPRLPNLTRTQLQEQIAKFGWNVGDHTYGKPGIATPQGELTIGKFVSMDAGVVINLAERRTDAVSSYPFHAHRKWWPNGAGTSDRVRKPVVIGNDVRIGTRAVIMPGVTIGDGAVIGAQSVVREDVPPYAIVEGVPAQVTGFRFDDATIERLLAVAWWNWPDEAINEFLPLMDGDIETFLVEAERLGL